MLHPPTSGSDDGWPGDDGTYDSSGRTLGLGVVTPLVCLALAVWCVASGEVAIPDDHGGPTLHVQGPAAVTAAVVGLIGLAAVFVGRYFWPNVFRRSAAGEPISAIGLMMAVGGLIGVFVAAFR